MATKVEQKIINSLKRIERLSCGSGEGLEPIDFVDDKGAGNLTNYTTYFKVSGGSSTEVVSLDEYGNIYTPTGTQMVEKDFAVARTTYNHRTITGANTWSPTDSTQYFMIDVITIGTPATPPTLTDSNSVSKPLRANRPITMGALTNTVSFETPENIILTSNIGDEIDVYWEDLPFV